MKNKIKVQRAIHDMTQADLAEAIQVSRQTINAIELGKYVPSTVLALKMAKIFKVSVDCLFELDETD
jgi:putative transcriptional regulator